MMLIVIIQINIIYFIHLLILNCVKTIEIFKKDTVKDSVNNTEPRKPVPMTCAELDVNHLLLSCIIENNDNVNSVDIRNDIPVDTAEKINYYIIIINW